VGGIYGKVVIDDKEGGGVEENCGLHQKYCSEKFSPIFVSGSS
jgi:hypothetical protein